MIIIDIPGCGEVLDYFTHTYRGYDDTARMVVKLHVGGGAMILADLHVTVDTNCLGYDVDMAVVSPDRLFDMPWLDYTIELVDIITVVDLQMLYPMWKDIVTTELV